MQAARLGRIQLPVYVRVAGSRNRPLQLVADAKAMGPWLELAVAPGAAPAAAPVAAAVAGGTPGDPAAGIAGEVGAGAAAGADGAAASSSEAGGAGSTAAPAASVSLNGGSSAAALAPEASSASQLTTASGTKRAGRKGKGPKEPAAPQWAGVASIKFDKAQVLQPHMQQLLLRNPTLIDSEVKLFVEGRDSVFEVGLLMCTL